MKRNRIESARRGNPAEPLREAPLRSMTGQELQQRLLLFAKRAKSLTGNGLDDSGQHCALGDQVSQFLTNLATNLTDPKAIAARNEFMAKVEADPEARKQFCALQLKTYNNYLLAEMQWINYFFTVTTLTEDGRPMVQKPQCSKHG